MKIRSVYSDQQVIFINNDSAMMPQLTPGSMLTGKYIDTYSWTHQANGLYAVLLDGGITRIRHIRENELQTKGILTLYSNNQGQQPEIVMADDIHSMYVIHKVG